MTQMTSPNKQSASGATHIPPRPMKLWLDTSHLQEVRIEIIPLIDVIFCILTFFILAAVGFSRQQAIDLDLPKASTGAPQMREMLVVSLDDLGKIYVEQQPVVSRNQLYQRLNEYHQSRPNGLMVLHASREVSYNEVIEVLDVLREVGGDRVALATLPGDAGKPTKLNPSSGIKSPAGSFNPLQQPSSSQFNPFGTVVPAAPSPTSGKKN
ncbi:MAG: biopolymer transporter ExbD [Moorea sp. SIO2B7]|nr:biopolymer transporter ExbD [Moorena sp. SIO2B7]